MAGRRQEVKTFNISVVGLSGREAEKGVTGVGKSCLINRFMRPLADEYFTDHISVLSQNDFGGRVVNNDHFLYWGDVLKTSDEGQDYRFQVIEQTEFIDDCSFQPFKSGKTDPYYKRCAQIKLQSAEKLMYICKNQLGLEHDYNEVLLHDGRINIDGFLCIFDVSPVQGRDLQRSVEYTALVLSNIIKTKKPVVLVTAKNDESHEQYIREAERLIAKKEYKGSIPIVETSAHKNVNVEQAFLTLAQLIDRTKGKPKVPLPYVEACRTQQERLSVAEDAYRVLIRFHVKDYKAEWRHVFSKLKDNQDYVHYVELFGTQEAQRLFRKHKRQLEQEFIDERRRLYLDYLRSLLPTLLPDLTVISDRSWPSILRWLPSQPWFDDYFVMPEGDTPWEQMLETRDERIPFTLLNESKADEIYRNHVNSLRAEHRRAELKKQFKQLLEDNHNVCPGKNLNEVAIFFLGRECFSNLCEADKAEIYDQHQCELRERARADYLELLLEHAPMLWPFEQKQVTKDHIQDIEDKLRDDPRYKALSKLAEDRQVILYKHLGFIQSKENCPEREFCIDMMVQQVLSTKAHRPQSWSQNSDFVLDTQDNKLNLVLLGSGTLADKLVQEIRLQCIDDEYTLEGHLYSLDYRPIDGDVSLPQNSFRTPQFIPHGCFCVYNNDKTLDYLWCSLEKTLLSEQDKDRSHFQGLPIVIVLGHNPNTTEKELEQLRDSGHHLAERLQCPFIDVPSSMMTDSTRRFHDDQISWAMCELVQCIRHRALLVNPWQVAESIEPDIRILLCMMCGDQYSVELPLAPLLNHQCCYVTDLERLPTITLETYLGESKRKVEVTVASYHSSFLLTDSLFHGYILVYWAKRKASLATLSAFSVHIPALVPTKILAVTEGSAASEFYTSEHVRGLLTEGNAVADRISASFMTTCPNFTQQTASYTPFFKECWDHKPDTESAFTFSDGDDGNVASVSQGDKLLYERHNLRPPATLPKPPARKDSAGIHGKSSASNSTEDSEPIYDRPHLGQCQSDSDVERTSSVSPPPHAFDHGDDIYSEIQDHDRLIKPSQVKTRRTAYAERYRKSFPSASPKSATMSYYHHTSSCREDSTDTDSSIRSPRLTSRPLSSGEPHYQFRKSNSMKLALKEFEEGSPKKLGAAASGLASDVKKRLLKQCTLPTLALHSDHHHYMTLPSHPTVDHPKPRHTTAGGYDDFETGLDSTKTSQTRSRPKVPPKPLDSYKFAEVNRVLTRNISKTSTDSQQALLLKSAPLATPEHIDIVGEYAFVRDAISPGVPESSDYASVADALPAGRIARIRSSKKKNHCNKGVHGVSQDQMPLLAGNEAGSDSDSEFSSLERDAQPVTDMYARVTHNRRPTPHKKKYKPRHSDSSVPAHLMVRNQDGEDKHLLVHSDQLEKVTSNTPSEGSGDTGDELALKKTKKRRSLKQKKKKPSLDEGHLIISPPWSDSDLTSSFHLKGSLDDDRYQYDDEESLELTDPTYWRRKLRIGDKKNEKDPEKMRMKEEKKRKEDEKRRQKEEEKRVKEQQKMAKKLQKKKDSIRINRDTPSQSSASVTLEDMAQSDEHLVPLFMETCIEFIEADGLDTEGLYRVPGNQAQVQQLMEKFREDPGNIDLEALDLPVNAVGTALKQWLRDLPEPLVPHYLFDELIQAAELQCDSQTTKMCAIRNVLKKLPLSNFKVLKYFISHLVKVSQHVKENSMSASNLAICWWPTLFRADITSMEKVTVISQHLATILQLLIENHDFFFYGQSEV